MPVRSAIEHARRKRILLRALPLMLFALACIGCGPDHRKPFVGVWRLDANYFREQLEKQEFESSDAQAALKSNIPLWESFKVEYVFTADGRFQTSTQMGGGKVAAVRGKYDLPEPSRNLVRLQVDGESSAKTIPYRFVDDSTLELSLEPIPGFPRTARFLRAKAEEQNAAASKEKSP